MTAEQIRTRFANIGSRGRAHRMRFGIIALGAAVVVSGVLLGVAAPRLWRVSVFVPLWIAGLGVFQARDKT